MSRKEKQIDHRWKERDRQTERESEKERESEIERERERFCSDHEDVAHSVSVFSSSSFNQTQLFEMFPC